MVWPYLGKVVDSRRAGYTLVEVVVALVLLQIGLLAMVGVLGRLAGLVSRSVRTAAVVELTAAALERSRAEACRGPGPTPAFRAGVGTVTPSVSSGRRTGIVVVDVAWAAPAARHDTLEAGVVCR